MLTMILMGGTTPALLDIMGVETGVEYKKPHAAVDGSDEALTSGKVKESKENNVSLCIYHM